MIITLFLILLIVVVVLVSPWLYRHISQMQLSYVVPKCYLTSLLLRLILRRIIYGSHEWTRLQILTESENCTIYSKDLIYIYFEVLCKIRIF